MIANIIFKALETKKMHLFIAHCFVLFYVLGFISGKNGLLNIINHTYNVATQHHFTSSVFNVVSLQTGKNITYY